MPGPGAAGARLLDAHFGVVMIDLVAEQLFHGIDDARQPGDGAPEVFACLVPKDQLGRPAFTVLQIVGVFA